MSICVRANQSSIVFFSIYQFIWPLLFELIILTFILSTLQDFYGYNPIISSRKLASSRSNHTVVLGYNHLGERIVEFLRNHKRPYSVVEIELDKVDDLISFNQPVVVGDYTDIAIMKLAGVEKCKEVFCVTTDLRRALIAAVKVRELNKTCALYMRVFDEHFRDYLTGEPWNAFTFSSSEWAMESVKTWCNGVNENNKIIVLGNDTIVKRIVEFYSQELKSEVYLFDPEIDLEVYNDLSRVFPEKAKIRFIENLEERFDMKEIIQMYICWNTEKLFSESILLSAAIKAKYPDIQLYVRIFDEELAQIAKSINTTTFSTSAYAFHMLQKEVKENSGIHFEKVK
ncbi:MAG: NAD-binding protein [Candidatus Thorarchaeota archaeon]